MIENSFLFLERISRKTEENVWGQNILDWDAFVNAKRIKGISSLRKNFYDRKITEARKSLYGADPTYFINKLPASEMWRLYDFFKEDAVFLDIETNGLRMSNDITVVGLFDGVETKVMIDGINLEFKALREELQKYKLLVTFNGASFDVPFIERRYPGVLPQIPHIDLCSVTRRLGMTGGLKLIEEKLGIERRQLVKGMYGGDALRLWRMYRATGDRHYLDLLVEYNEEDVINLKKIANYFVAQLKEQTINKYLRK